MRKMNRLTVAVSLIFPAILLAQVGSPDVFLAASAGPYPLFITVRTPRVIPGIAEVEIRSDARDLKSLHLVPTPVTGVDARYAPSPFEMLRSGSNPNLFTGSMWLMAAGSWKVCVLADGERGPGELFVPFPAAMGQPATMSFALGALIALLGLSLVTGAAGIAGASTREAQLEPGLAPSRTNKVAARLIVFLTLAVAGGLLYCGGLWWKNEAEHYKRLSYTPLPLNLELDSDGKLFASVLEQDRTQSARDLIPDRGHFMHMFVVSVPALDKMWLLHPDMQAGGVFTMRMPEMDAGNYRVFGNIVHANGFPETVTAALELKEPLRGTPLEGDDAQTAAVPAGKNSSPGVFVLSDKYRMVMVRGNKPIRARAPDRFTFRVETKSGRPAEDLELYMGLPGHAVFLKHDQSVFAQVHPMGSAPTIAMQMLNPQAPPPSGSIATHSMNMGIPAEISFPYAVPSPGDYRIFVQVKRAGKIETGTFDINAVE